MTFIKNNLGHMWKTGFSSLSLYLTYLCQCTAQRFLLTIFLIRSITTFSEKLFLLCQGRDLWSRTYLQNYYRLHTHTRIVPYRHKCCYILCFDVRGVVLKHLLETSHSTADKKILSLFILCYLFM